MLSVMYFMRMIVARLSWDEFHPDVPGHLSARPEFSLKRVVGVIYDSHV